MRKIISLIVACAGLCGCASTPTCPSVAEEAVSTCRAKAECHHGARTSIGMILGGFNPSSSTARNPAVEQYNQCIDNSLRAQKANAGIQSNSYSCKSDQTSAGHVETKCEQQ